jgi:hypothetical protein
VRNAWLFAKDWVQESAEELDDGDLDFSKRDERIDAGRRTAMQEIWSGRGFDGVKALLAGSEAPFAVGRCAAPTIPDLPMATEFVRGCLALDGDQQRKADGCLQGFLVTLEESIRANVLRAVLADAAPQMVARLLCCAPFRRETWSLVDQSGTEVVALYWREVSPWWRGHSDEDRLEMVDRLLAARRPRAAFFAVHLDWDKVETSRLKRLLQAVATVGDEGDGRYRLDPHDLSGALTSIPGRPGVTETEMAHLEFLYLRALDHTEHGIPNLERQIAQSPLLFVQAVAITFKRNDEGQDPPEWRIDTPERHAALATSTYRLFESIKLTPGTERDGTVNRDKLLHWINETRRLCVEHGRPEIGDQCIGKLLARSAPGPDGEWPSLAVWTARLLFVTRRVNLLISYGSGLDKAKGEHLGADDDGLQLYRVWRQPLRSGDPVRVDVLRLCPQEGPVSASSAPPTPRAPPPRISPSPRAASDDRRSTPSFNGSRIMPAPWRANGMRGTRRTSSVVGGSGRLQAIARLPPRLGTNPTLSANLN